MVKKKPVKKEKYGKTTHTRVYHKGKPAFKHNKTGKIKIPSDKYVKKHHPRGPWNS